MPYWTPRPVASRRPRMPPWLRGLAGRACEIVDVTPVQCVEGVGDPGHLAFAGAHVWGGNIDAGSDEVLAGKLGGEAARESLERFFGVEARVDADAALGTTKGDVDDRAFVRHESGERHDFVGGDVFAVTDAAFERLLVVAVLGTPSFAENQLLSHAYGKLHGKEVVAYFDLSEQRLGDVEGGGCFVELRRDNVVEVEVLETLCPARRGLRWHASSDSLTAQRPNRPPCHTRATGSRRS